MRDQLEEVLLLQTEYTHLNTPAWNVGRSWFGNRFRASCHRLPQLAAVGGVQDLQTQGRDGTGPKSAIPWTRVYSQGRSPRATVGWYLVYLFSAEGDRVYLSLNQGATTWSGGAYVPRPVNGLLARVAWARERPALSAAPDMDGWAETIQLDAHANKLAQGYEAGNVIAREYALDAIPSDDALEADLRRAVGWLGDVYRATDPGLDVPGEAGPVVADVELAVEISAGNSRRRGGQGFWLTADEKKVIELRVVEVATDYLSGDGWKVRDVGATKSYDLHARKGDHHLMVEVKGTTSPGETIILTRNEVLLHLKEFPNTALAIVHSIVLDRTGTPPRASGGVLVYEQPWALNEDRLTPMAYRYDTGLGALASVAVPDLEGLDVQL